MKFDFEKRNIKRHVYIVIYDVVDNKKRNALSKFLEGYGTRIQKSAFEIIIEPQRYKKLIQQIGRIIDKETDDVKAIRCDKDLVLNIAGNNYVREQSDLIVV